MTYLDKYYELDENKIKEKITYLITRIDNALTAKQQYKDETPELIKKREEDLNENAEEDDNEDVTRFGHPPEDKISKKHKKISYKYERILVEGKGIDDYIHNIKHYLLSSNMGGKYKTESGLNIMSRVYNAVRVGLFKWFCLDNMKFGGLFSGDTNYSYIILYAFFKTLKSEIEGRSGRNSYNAFVNLLNKGNSNVDKIKELQKLKTGKNDEENKNLEAQIKKEVTKIMKEVNRAKNTLLAKIFEDLIKFKNNIDDYDYGYIYIMIFVMNGPKRKLVEKQQAQTIYDRLSGFVTKYVNELIESKNNIYELLIELISVGYFPMFGVNFEDTKLKPEEEEEEEENEPLLPAVEDKSEDKSEEDLIDNVNPPSPSPPTQSTEQSAITESGAVPVENQTEITAAAENQMENIIENKETENQATVSTVTNTMAEQLYRDEPKNIFELIKYYLAKLNERLKTVFNGANNVENDFTSAVLNRFYALFMSDQNIIYQYLKAGKEIFKDQNYITYITNNTEFLGLNISVGSLLSTYEMVAVKFNNTVSGITGANVAKIGTIPNYLRAILKNGRIIGIMEESIKISEYGFSPQRIELEQNKIISSLMNSGLLTVALQTQRLDPSTGLPVTDQYGNPVFDTTYSYKGVPLTDKEVRQIVIGSLVRDFTSVLGPILTDKQLQRRRTKNYYGIMKDSFIRDTQVSNLNRIPNKMNTKKTKVEVPQRHLQRDYDVLSYMKRFMVYNV